MPLYEKLSNDEWRRKINFFEKNYRPCNLCPRQCQAERKHNNPGVCQASYDVKIASYNLHFGEEPPISGVRGSGTIFFSGCTLKCLFCQNYPISQMFNGEFYSIEELADIFLYLQKLAVHNINLVSPTPYLFHFIKALHKAYKKGLKIPVVYNTSGYERPLIVKMLAGAIDIYMPDLKYYSDKTSWKYSGVKNYFRNAYHAVEEMFKQTGPLLLDKDGIAKQGVLIRHLILPGNVEDSKKVLQAIVRGNFRNSYLSLMSQYFPAYRASDSNLNRRLNAAEYQEIKNYAIALGLKKGWFQDI